MTFECPICGQKHDELPDIGADRPDPYWRIPESERDRRITLTGDTCEIDGEQFFIRGVLRIPIHEEPDGEGFGFGVWVSLKPENYKTYLANFDSEEIGPFFGWLCTRLTCYHQDTLLLKTMAHFRGEGQRPFIRVEPGDHPLSVDQHCGFSIAKAWEIVHLYQQEDG